MLYRKVFNIVTIPVIIIGLIINLINFGTKGLVYSLIGIMTGFIFLFPVYIIGGVGAGDIKFLMAVGSVKWAGFVFMGGLYGAIIALFGVIYSIIKNKRFIITLNNIKKIFIFLIGFKFKDILILSKNSPLSIPYTIFLSLGMLIRWFELIYIKK